MCTTCGCGSTNNILIMKPGEENVEFSEFNKFSLEDNSIDNHTHDHNHGHSHTHNHSNEKTINLEIDVLSENNLLAQKNRGYLEAKNILAINLVSSPGSGKTSLLERTLSDLKDKYKFYVIEGDQQTMNDANRIDATGAPVVQINTGQGCHLDSDMVYSGIKKLNPDDNSIIMIENVGNLVCPALFDLGEDKRVVIISTTEGDDKPIKYPDMFAGSDICIINKIDLLPYVNFDVAKTKEYALSVNHNLIFVEVSATTGEGMEDWYAVLANLKKGK